MQGRDGKCLVATVGHKRLSHFPGHKIEPVLFREGTSFPDFEKDEKEVTLPWNDPIGQQQPAAEQKATVMLLRCKRVKILSFHFKQVA